MKIELGDLFCYDYYNNSDYGCGYYITEEIEIANEENKYFWEEFNNNNCCGHKLKWILKKDILDKNKINKRRMKKNDR